MRLSDVGQAMNQVIDLYEQAFAKAYDASFQSHTGHWDSKGTGGRNCPECIRAKRLRAEAQGLLERAQELKGGCLRDQ